MNWDDFGQDEEAKAAYHMMVYEVGGNKHIFVLKHGYVPTERQLDIHHQFSWNQACVLECAHACKFLTSMSVVRGSLVTSTLGH